VVLWLGSPGASYVVGSCSHRGRRNDNRALTQHSKESAETAKVRTRPDMSGIRTKQAQVGLFLVNAGHPRIDVARRMGVKYYPQPADQLNSAIYVYKKSMPNIKNDQDSLSVVELPGDELFGDQTQGSLEVKHWHSWRDGQESAAGWV
jgi:hypothetical protein